MLARIKALLRRAAPQPASDDVLRFGRLEVDLGARVARLGGTICDLTGHQFDLLVVLAQSPGRVLSRSSLLDGAWDMAFERRSNIVDVYVRYLREKIDRPFGTDSLETVRGVGYRLRSSA